MTGYQVYPAPYIASPQHLIHHTSGWPGAAFIRLRNPAAPDRITDIFHAGDSPNWTAFHDAKSPHHWQRHYRQMLNFERNAPLVGCFSYEFGFQFEPDRWKNLPCADGQPIFQFIELDAWYQADHATRTAAICAAPETSRNTIDNFTEYLHEAISAVHKSPTPSVAAADSTTSNGTTAPEQTAQFGERTPQDYAATVDNILEDIRSGRYYELNFTQRFQRRSPIPPNTVFTHLMQKLNPAYAFYAKMDDNYIVSASPELFLHKQGATIQTCPIKGSYRHTPSPAEMAKLHAEHTMVVDLARNDLGRISDIDWVRVAEQSEPRHFGQITHLESRITGQTSQTLHEILAATLPAASITGTPKVISVQSIAQYEQTPRQIYTGNCGILWPNGDLQLNVAIRTLHARLTSPEKLGQQWDYTFGAGGAIVADSSPKQEYQECLMKAAPLIHALNSALIQPPLHE